MAALRAPPARSVGGVWALPGGLQLQAPVSAGLVTLLIPLARLAAGGRSGGSRRRWAMQKPRAGRRTGRRRRRRKWAQRKGLR